jgi:integrase
LGVTKTASGKWRATIYNASEKRNEHIGVYDTKREAREAEQARIGNAPERQTTVGRFAARWTTDYPRPKESTNMHNAGMIKRFAAEHVDTQLDRVTPAMARAWCLERKSDLQALRAMFGDAKRDNYIRSNPFSDLRIPRGNGRRDLQSEWLTAADVDHLVKTASTVNSEATGVLVGSIIQFAAYTGIRPGELFALTHDCINGNDLEIRGALNSHTGTITTPKNGRTRTIALVAQAREAIERTPRLDDNLVFTSPAGRMLRQPAWWQLWNPVRNAAGRPGMDFYELRHFAATWLLELGLSPFDVATQLGHTDGGALVMSTYGHPSERAARNRILNAAQIDADEGHGTVRRIG